MKWKESFKQSLKPNKRRMIVSFSISIITFMLVLLLRSSSYYYNPWRIIDAMLLPFAIVYVLNPFNWRKVFWKLDKEKIVVFTVFLIISIYLLLNSGCDVILVSGAGHQAVCQWQAYARLYLFPLFLLYFDVPLFNGAFLIYLYFLSCLIMHVYKKIRNNKS